MAILAAATLTPQTQEQLTQGAARLLRELNVEYAAITQLLRDLSRLGALHVEQRGTQRRYTLSRFGERELERVNPSGVQVLRVSDRPRRPLGSLSFGNLSPGNTRPKDKESA